MTFYRAYCVGGHGKIEAAEWLEASSDEDAMMIVRARKRTSDCELWDRGRLVARVPKHGAMAFFVPATAA